MRHWWFYIVLIISTLPTSSTTAAAEEEVRQWRSADEKSVLGSLVGADTERVVLNVKGKEFVLPLSKLSEEDREFVSQWRKRHPRRKPPEEAPTEPLKPWPKVYEGRSSAKVEELEAHPRLPGFHFYRTAHYDFAFERELSRKNLDEIAAVFESVSSAMESLPLEHLHPADWHRDRRFQAVFLNDMESYARAGGPTGSVGVFDMRTRRILIRIDALLTPPSRRRLAMPQRERYKVLVHELTHQVIFPRSARMPLWYSEGIAEYMATAHFAPARFDFRNITRLIKGHIGRFIPFDEDGSLELPSPAEVVAMDHEAWSEHNRLAPVRAFKKYVTSLLLTHYFQHADGSMASRLNAFLDAYASPRSAKGAFEAHLLNGRPIESLSESIRKFWDGQGLKIRFK